MPQLPNPWLITPHNFFSTPISAFLLQVVIVANHLNGKDTHVRGLRVLGPKLSVSLRGRDILICPPRDPSLTLSYSSQLNDRRGDRRLSVEVVSVHAASGLAVMKMRDMRSCTRRRSSGESTGVH